MAQQETREIQARVYTSIKDIQDLEIDPNYIVIEMPNQTMTKSGLHIPQGASRPNNDRLTKIVKAGADFKHLEGKLAVSIFPGNLGDNIEIGGTLYFIVRGSSVFTWIDESKLSSLLSV